MAKVFSMDLRLEVHPTAYILADSEEQALEFFTTYIRTPEGEAYLRRKMEMYASTNLYRPVVGMKAYDMGDQWPVEMHELDARLTDPDRTNIAS